MDIKKLGDALLKAGAPVLKGLVENAVGGGIKGKIAGGIIDALGEAFGSKDPDVIAGKIESDPGAAVVVRDMEASVIHTMEISAGDLTAYIGVLRDDQKAEGILSRLWRPLFAIVFTACFGVQVITVCWLLWTRQLGTLKELSDIVTFLSFLDVAGAAVLGVQIWKKTEEKTAGV